MRREAIAPFLERDIPQLGLRIPAETLRRLRPWAANVGKRLVRTPKVYVRDSGLAHALLGLTEYDDVIGHPVAGGSWEGWVIENLLAAAPPAKQAWFYRSSAGAEIDLVLELPKRQCWAIEIKRSSAPVASRGHPSSTVRARKSLISLGRRSQPQTTEQAW